MLEEEEVYPFLQNWTKKGMRGAEMIFAIQILIAGIVGSLLLLLVSEEFAYRVSRVAETLFDYVEYKLALRAQGRLTRTRRADVLCETI